MRRKCTETNECKNTETEELWKKIDFIKNINPNLYEISSLGRVKSFHDGKEKILQPRLYDRAYNVSLSSKWYSRNVSVGRLVAIAFIPNQNGYKYVKHKDGNVKNNNITNLQWCSKSEYDSRTKTNKYIKINNQTYKLIINNTDEVLFDSEDYNTISSYHWKLNKYGYAYSHHIAMHRLVLNNPDGIVDHIDHNKLNNKKNNLRICTIQENNRNRDKKKSKYGVLGVYPILSKWIARIMHKGIKYNLGTFDTYEEAAVARIEKEIELFGEFSSQKHLLEKYKKLIKE